MYSILDPGLWRAGSKAGSKATNINSIFYFCILGKHNKTPCAINTLRPRQNGRHFADDTFKHIFMNEHVRISTNISSKFVPQGLINNIPALVQIKAWRRPGDKPLSESMMISLPTHICGTRPQWVKSHLLTEINKSNIYSKHAITKSSQNVLYTCTHEFVLQNHEYVFLLHDRPWISPWI